MNGSGVLIVGAGPTGLTLACLLADLGIPFRLIDKSKSPSRDSKAFVVHARTMEVFAMTGFAEKIISHGKQLRTASILVHNKEVVRLDLTNLLSDETHFPYVLIIPQNQLENILIDELKQKGHQVHWQNELVDLKQDDLSVEALVKPESNKNIAYQYVIGCDGVGSTVRNKAGFTFVGSTIPYTFYLADCELSAKQLQSDVVFFVSDNYLTGVFPYKEKNRYRVFNFLNKAIDKRKNESLNQDELQKILDSNQHVKIRANEMDWSSVFKINTRYTQSFRHGRVFLAGDAAHVHSPAGGQGMNTGIQDAFNLAWKLRLTIRKKSNTHLLDTYSLERVPIAQNLHNTTDRFFRIIISKNLFIDFFRKFIFKYVLKLTNGIEVWRKINFRRLSQLSIKYRFSPLSINISGSRFLNNAPRPGDRAPFCKVRLDEKETDTYQLFDYNRFTLFVAVSEKSQNVLQEIYDLEKLSPISMKMYIFQRQTSPDFFTIYGIKTEAIFLIRPDTHIGLRSSVMDLKNVKGYLQGLSI